ncbi:MAG: hypothetical protein HYW63_04290 [Candidatus Levybacteria bacterium]|nr:hypothetical protein [Candidatus Levybacteria bacterium]
MEKEPLERWHGAHHYSNKIHLILVIFLLFAAVAILGTYFVLNNSRFSYKKVPSPSVSITPTPPFVTPTPGNNDSVVCTQDAMLCPDGTWVGRTGPKCEFICPARSEDESSSE